MHQCITFIIFWNDTSHVSDGVSVHHQEFKTVHTTTYICQTYTAVWQMSVAVCRVLNSWWWTETPSETCRVSFENKINLIHRCICVSGKSLCFGTFHAHNYRNFQNGSTPLSDQLISPSLLTNQPPKSQPFWWGNSPSATHENFQIYGPQCLLAWPQEPVSYYYYYCEPG